MSRRAERVSHLIQMELGQVLLHKMKDPRMGMITVTHVGVAADLKSARVFYSVLGDEQARISTQIALERGTGFLQREIATALKLRYTPKLTFAFDDSLDQGIKIDRVLHELQKEQRQHEKNG